MGSRSSYKRSIQICYIRIGQIIDQGLDLIFPRIRKQNNLLNRISCALSIMLFKSQHLVALCSSPSGSLKVGFLPLKESVRPLFSCFRRGGALLNLFKPLRIDCINFFQSRVIYLWIPILFSTPFTTSSLLIGWNGLFV